MLHRSIIAIAQASTCPHRICRLIYRHLHSVDASRYNAASHHGEDVSKARQYHAQIGNPSRCSSPCDRTARRVFACSIASCPSVLPILWSICRTASWRPARSPRSPTAREIVPNVNRISAAVRKAGGLVVYIQNTFDAVAVAHVVDLLRTFLQPGTPGAHDRHLLARRVRTCDLAGARRAAAGSAGAEAPLRCLRARLVRPACDPAAARHRHADRHRHRDAGLLRVRPRATR